MDTGAKFESWALVELFGHTRMIGKVTEQTIGGIPFVRVDVPADGDRSAYTRFLGNGAIYSITPLEETAARALLVNVREEPIQPWEIRRLLETASSPAETTALSRCRVCGCTDDDCRDCIEKTGEPCHWVENDLCSACAEEEES